jgi:hypothetical protein
VARETSFFLRALGSLIALAVRETGYFLRTSNSGRCRCDISSVQRDARCWNAADFIYLARIACGLHSRSIRSPSRTAKLLGGLPTIDLCYCVERTMCRAKFTFFLSIFFSFPAAPSFSFREVASETCWKMRFHYIVPLILWAINVVFCRRNSG